MNIEQNVDLKLHSTMRLGGRAAYGAVVTREDQLPELVSWARSKNLPVLMIGNGSNIIWKDDGFAGLLLMNNITGRRIISEDSDGATVELGSGNIWDSDVEWAVSQNLSGIENLSLIPGTTGATPIQNVGAYGVEISSTLRSVRAFDSASMQFVSIGNKDCAFSYRSSRFKTSDRGRFLITGVTLALSRLEPEPPFYEALNKYFQVQAITTFDLATVRRAVIAVRSAKLPDPAVVANNGSFFTNPIVSAKEFADLVSQFPDIRHWSQPGGSIKLSAAWLVEQCGFKGISDPETGMSTWPKHALVLVNEHANTTADLMNFKQKIVSAVNDKFKVQLKQEPELLPQT